MLAFSSKHCSAYMQPHRAVCMAVNSFVCFNLCAWCSYPRVCVQDVDSAYLVKADLEDKVGALTDEINFLRNVYEEVMELFHALKH